MGSKPTNKQWRTKHGDPLRVAIVHDWLYGGGAELVVEQLHTLFPDAPIYTSYCTDEWRARLDHKVITEWLQHLGKIRKFIPFLRIWWFSHLDFSGYDLVISSTGAEAKGIQVPKGTLHVSYIHAPTHYYWSRYEEYLAHPGFGAFDWLARIGLKLLVGPLRHWDYKAAQRPDHLIANSTHIQEEIKKYYRRESTVIHPPVRLDRFRVRHVRAARNGFVVAGRHVAYKRFDIAIEACNALKLPLTVIGDGPDNARLRSLAGPTVTFTGKITDKEIADIFAGAAAFLFPGLDDFGIAAVEALASGTPVIAYKAGGALDYVAPGKTGQFFTEQTAKSLQEVLKSFNPTHYDNAQITAYAKQFSAETFRSTISVFISKSRTSKT